jgi:diguanylate cyclase (GGDEF)-like protein
MPISKRDRPTIGILPAWSPVIGNAPDRYLSSVVAGIQSAARLRGCDLLMAWGIRQEGVESTNLFPAWPVVSSDSDFVPVGPWNTDGLIVLAPLRDRARSEYLRQLRDQGFPVLFVATGEDGPAISAGNEEGIQQAVAHLVGHGHRRIAFIAGDVNDKGDSESRLNAYRAAVAKHGLADDPALIVHGGHTDQGGHAALMELRASQVEFTAVVSSDDNSAIGAMRAIREAGLRIPNDIAVIGFDDQPEAVAQVPALTSVHVPLPEIGQQAVLLMLDHLNGLGRLESIRIPTRLVPRQSCGCMPAVVRSASWAISNLKQVSQSQSESAEERLEAVKKYLTNEMLAALPAQSRIAVEERSYDLCYSLVEAFNASLGSGNSDRFEAALVPFLQMMELMEINLDVWQEMISILRREMVHLPQDWDRVGTYRLAGDMLHQTRVAISESAVRRDQQHKFQWDARTHAMGMLTSLLSGALEAHQVAQVLRENAARVGIRGAHLATFESEGDDPVAWSILLDQDPESALHRFPTREFPPAGLCEAGEPLSLSLLPLVFQNEALGYVAFEGGELGSWLSIARQLAVALKVAGLHKQVVDLSLTDPLTGLYNRRYFDLFLKNEVQRCKRFSRTMTVLLLDLDYLKTYNDIYGHPEGDHALRQIAGCLLDRRRTADVVARLGGDEFAIILPETELEGGLTVSAKIHNAMAGLAGLKRQFTFSIGLAVFNAAETTPEKLVWEADQALYDAKRRGRNQTCMFDAGRYARRQAQGIA